MVVKASAVAARLAGQWRPLCLSALLLGCTPTLAVTVPPPASASAPQTATPTKVPGQTRAVSQAQAQAQAPAPSTVVPAPVVCPIEDWPLWTEFLKFFVTADGRVIYSFPPKADSVSEGQSYAMFFALIANDPVNFEKIWRSGIQQCHGIAVALLGSFVSKQL